ncbi:H-NS family nucleoid-associated regulatory protein [Burkholderia sp. Bp8963]|uniref:H-NS histone family protein n=1 Tax=Burkholderia sp. Bp8963 TaxID=2184547 RepID=UPI0026C4E5DF|nr:H-NS family nucleoid-associated regulatory protein [Burkholderia sp. Bp8963]
MSVRIAPIHSLFTAPRFQFYPGGIYSDAGGKEYGITELELLRAAGFVKDKPKKLPAKYYDPSSGKSWTGRGACPKWLAGKNLDDYLIRPAAKPWWPGEN